MDTEVTNPLQAATELMALEERDISKFMQAFEKIDVKKRGKITEDQIFDYFESTPTSVAKSVFTSMDAYDKDGYMEFADFVRCCGTFCFFGTAEMLK